MAVAEETEYTQETEGMVKVVENSNQSDEETGLPVEEIGGSQYGCSQYSEMIGSEGEDLREVPDLPDEFVCGGQQVRPRLSRWRGNIEQPYSNPPNSPPLV